MPVTRPITASIWHIFSLREVQRGPQSSGARPWLTPLAGVPAFAAIYDPVGPVPPVAAHGLRFAVYQLAAACMFDQYRRDQHRHRHGRDPGLDDLAPKVV